MSPNEAGTDRPARFRRRQEPLEELRPTRRRRAPTSVQAPASGAEDAALVSTRAPVIAAMMKTVPPRRYNAEIAVGSPIRRRSQSDCSSSVWKRTSRNRLAIEKMTRNVSCSRTVSNMLAMSSRPMTTTALMRPPMTECRVARELRRRPGHEPEDQQVMAEDRCRQSRLRTTRSDQAPTTSSVAFWNRTPGCRPCGTSTQPTSSGMSRAAKIAPNEWVVQRPQPTSGPRNPASDPADRRPEQEVRLLVAAEDQQRVVERPRECQADEDDQCDREPAVDSTQRARRS